MSKFIMLMIIVNSAKDVQRKNHKRAERLRRTPVTSRARAWVRVGDRRLKHFCGQRLKTDSTRPPMLGFVWRGAPKRRLRIANYLSEGVFKKPRSATIMPQPGAV